jgi:uncharacterized LabA/DUF88 family protein
MQTLPVNLGSERCAVFVDFPNTQQMLRSAGRSLDILALRTYLSEGRHLLEAFVFVLTHPDGERAAEDQALVRRLREHGFLTFARPGELQPDGRLTGACDVDLALEVQDFIARARPDIIALVSSSVRLAPVVALARRHGVRVEIAATPAAVTPALRAAANGFVDLLQIAAPVDHLPVPPIAAGADAERVADLVAPAAEPDFDFVEPLPELAFA